MPTKEQFDEAVQRLLGEKKYGDLSTSGYSRPDFCREIAQDAFIGALLAAPTQVADLNLIRAVSERLWVGDGVTGLTD